MFVCVFVCLFVCLFFPFVVVFVFVVLFLFFSSTYYWHIKMVKEWMLFWRFAPSLDTDFNDSTVNKVQKQLVLSILDKRKLINWHILQRQIKFVHHNNTGHNLSQPHIHQTLKLYVKDQKAIMISSSLLNGLLIICILNLNWWYWNIIIRNHNF